MSKRFPLIAIIVLLFLGGLWYSGREGYITVPFLSPTDSITTLSAQTTAADLVAKVVKKYNIDKKHLLDLNVISAVPGDIERRNFNGEFTIMNIGVVSTAEGYKKGAPSTVIGPVLPMTY